MIIYYDKESGKWCKRAIADSEIVQEQPSEPSAESQAQWRISQLTEHLRERALFTHTALFFRYARHVHTYKKSCTYQAQHFYLIFGGKTGIRTLETQRV